MTGTKNSQLPKIFGSLPADHTKEFLKFGHSSKSFQPELLAQIANQLSLLTKKYLTSKVHFDIIYLKMTENARSVTTENTLVHISSCKIDLQCDDVSLNNDHFTLLHFLLHRLSLALQHCWVVGQACLPSCLLLLTKAKQARGFRLIFTNLQEIWSLSTAAVHHKGGED